MMPRPDKGRVAAGSPHLSPYRERGRAPQWVVKVNLRFAPERGGIGHDQGDRVEQRAVVENVEGGVRERQRLWESESETKGADEACRQNCTQPGTLLAQYGVTRRMG